MLAVVLLLRREIGGFAQFLWYIRVGLLFGLVAAGAAAYAIGLWLAGLRPRHLREA